MCGARISDGRRGARSTSSAWVLRAAAAGVVAVIGAALAVVATGSDGGRATVTTAIGGFATAPDSTTGEAPVGRSGVAEWPTDEDGWTIALASLPQTAGRTAALTRARTARRKGLPQVGVLDSSRYASLHPGYWIVFSVLIDLEGVHRSETIAFVPNTVQYIPEFDNGGGLGGGVNLFFSDRMSLELKVAGLASRLRVRRTGSDFVTTVDLGYAQIYPITAVLQWHMLEDGAIRPYIGAGAGYILLRNIEKDFIGLSGVEFDNPIGLVLDGGLRIPFSKRWAAYGDARYTPIETQARARFVGSTTIEEIDVKPLIISFGIAYSF